jgi:Flp pilus assembly protein TadD
MKLQFIIMAAIPGLILFAVLFSGCSSGGKRNTEALINQINDSTLSAEQRTLLLAELGTKALQETKDTTLWPNYAQLLLSAGYTSSGLKIYRDEMLKHPDDKELQVKVVNAELACMIIPGYPKSYTPATSQVDYRRELETIRSLDEKIADSPYDPGLYVIRGNCFMVIDEESAGTWDLKKSLALDSCFTDALFSVAVMEMRKMKNQESVTTMRQLENCIHEKNIVPKRTWLDFNAFLHTIAMTDSLIGLNPGTPDYYVQKARIYAQGKEYELAISALDEGLKASPENGKIYAFRAYVNYSAGNQQEALHDLAQAEQLTGKTDTELSNLIRGIR